MMEKSNLSNTEFRVMIIRILNNMKKRQRNQKEDQSEIKNAISEINNTSEVINSRLDEAEDQISNLGLLLLMYYLFQILHSLFLTGPLFGFSVFFSCC